MNVFCARDGEKNQNALLLLDIPRVEMAIYRLFGRWSMTVEQTTIENLIIFPNKRGTRTHTAYQEDKINVVYIKYVLGVHTVQGVNEL